MDDRIATPRIDVDTLLDRLAYTEQRIAAKAARWEVEAYRRAFETLHGEALQRLVTALQENPAAAAILEEAAGDDVVYTVLRQHDIIKPPIESRVQKALEKVRPLLANHGGDFEIVAIAPPRVTLRLLGACHGCPAQVFTLRSVIAGALKRDCPEITQYADVDAPDGVEMPVGLENEGWRPAGLTSELPAEGARDLTIERQDILLARRGDKVSCFAAYCPHRGVAVDSRDIESDGLLTCYRHGFRFDLATGTCLSASGYDLEVHEVKIVDDKILVKMPVR